MNFWFSEIGNDAADTTEHAGKIRKKKFRLVDDNRICSLKLYSIHQAKSSRKKANLKLIAAGFAQNCSLKFFFDFDNFFTFYL